MRPEINKKIEETLNSLDGIRRAEPRPFFYTRLMGRLQRNEKTIWETMGSFMAKPVVVIAGLCFILVFNAFMLLRQDAANAIQTQASNEQLATDNEYLLATNSSFDFENLDPQ